jgi:hypothetical protein
VLRISGPKKRKQQENAEICKTLSSQLAVLKKITAVIKSRKDWQGK